MRIIVRDGNLNINFENIAKIIDYGDHIDLVGDLIDIAINAMIICSMSTLTIWKNWLLTADEVYLDTRIEEDN